MAKNAGRQKRPACTALLPVVRLAHRRARLRHVVERIIRGPVILVPGNERAGLLSAAKNPLVGWTSRYRVDRKGLPSLRLVCKLRGVCTKMAAASAATKSIACLTFMATSPPKRNSPSGGGVYAKKCFNGEKRFAQREMAAGRPKFPVQAG